MPDDHLFGLGLRRPHYDAFLSGSVAVDFVEVISENFMFAGGHPQHVLTTVRGHYPVALHGVSLSIGSASGLDADYLRQLRALVDRVDPLLVSDHISWSRHPGFNSHDLLPLPYTQEALTIVAANVQQAQDAIGRQMIFENPSSYLDFTASEMPEWEFVAQLCAQTGCGLLLDVNNVFVSGRNLGFDPDVFIANFPMQHVRQIHLAGHTAGEPLLIDTHDQPVVQGVWDLYRKAMARLPRVATMIERDDNIPELPELLAELDVARANARTARSPQQASA
ncbi:MAG: hypothetical protein RLZZ08_1465 [Pseudomonadota bacterium]|jgi:uncharacterized protein (UPF0276 family)